MMNHLLMAVTTAFAAAVWAGEPLVWERRPNRPAPAQFDTFHGETLEFRCTFTGFGALPFSEGGDVRLWYQTNGMGAAWWSVPATVASNVFAATFPPSADPGAARLTVFFGAPSNVYAAAQVRFRNSPGPHPNNLEPPSVLDWQSELAAATNALWASSTNYTDQAIGAFAATGTVNQATTASYATDAERASVAITAQVAERLGDPDTYELRTAAQIFGQIDSKTTTNDVCNIVTNEVSAYGEWVFHGYASAAATDVPVMQWTGSEWMPCSTNPVSGGAAPSLGEPKGDAHSTALSWTAGEDANSSFSATREIFFRNALGLATLKDLEGKADASITNDIEKLKAESTLVYRLFSGSNIVMEVTNYNSRTNPQEMRLMRLDDKGIYEVMWTETNGLERTYNRAASNTAEQVAALDRKAAETYAPRGWSATTSGLGADAPKDTTWISTPTTVIAGGLEYSKVVTSSGQLWFLRSNGMAVNMGGNSGGYFDISASDGTRVFSIEKTDSYMAPVDADGISVNGNTVTIRLSVVSADHPFLRYAPTLNAPVEWQKEEDGFSSPIAVSWTGSSGAWVAIVTTTAKEGFFQFEFFQEGGTKIKNGGAMDVSAGGILCTDGIHKCRPVWSNGTITWEAF